MAQGDLWHVRSMPQLELPGPDTVGTPPGSSYCGESDVFIADSGQEVFVE